MNTTTQPGEDEETPWKGNFTSSAEKQKGKLPTRIRERLLALVLELKLEGPIQREWKHFGKLEGSKNKDVYHCHLNSGRPVYVVIWEVKNQEAQIMKIVYDDTHENANYRHYAS
ncbi:MAG: cytotoxic translational repressor of toxin-antitoxin stability system [Desulfovibrio sp.]|jgi:mRNA-degrading endonuclease RelE of RelBE toxin-antitoxin system|nr:cytotoxic translational repressor of toxin-antitoxin stability system [Desulfovibrio sp.]